MIGFILALVQYQLELQWALAFKILLCMVFARSAAMAFNRWTDRDIDAQNSRTKIREIPAGIIKANFTPNDSYNYILHLSHTIKNL